MRIGEALALWLEDVEPDAHRIHIVDRGELANLSEIKTVCSPRTVDVSADLINLFFEYIVEAHTDDVDTNHVFIKLSGQGNGFGITDSHYQRRILLTGRQVFSQSGI